MGDSLNPMQTGPHQGATRGGRRRGIGVDHHDELQRAVDLRVSDADRDQAATELGEHFQAGRLDQGEFDERLTAALKARTRGDLDRLLADLPAARRPDPPLPSGPARSSPDFRPLLALIPLVLVLLLVAVGGRAHHGGPGGAWPLVWLWWVIIPAVLFRIRRRRWQPGDPGARPGKR
jgi:Domain of unknown function (DUF1707)